MLSESSQFAALQASFLNTGPIQRDTNCSGSCHLWVRRITLADAVELPVPGNAFEFVDAAVVELDSRACDEVFDGARDEYFSRATAEMRAPM